MRKFFFIFVNPLLLFCLINCTSSDGNINNLEVKENSNSISTSINTQKTSKDGKELSENKWTSLNPPEFKDLPIEIIQHLQSLNCMIPQSFISDKPHNVIQGEFIKKGQKDWVVLCFRNNDIDKSELLLYPKSSSKSVMKISEGSNSGLFQNFDGYGTMGFSRAIYTVDKKYIIDHNQEDFRKGKLPPIDHDGISDAFVEKASTVLYLHKGKWLDFAGAD